MSRVYEKTLDQRFLLGKERGKIENKDCAVVAFSIATGIPYAEMHSLFESRGRKYGKGTSWSTIHSVVTELKRRGYRITLIERPRQSKTVSKTHGYGGLQWTSEHRPRFTIHAWFNRLIISGEYNFSGLARVLVTSLQKATTRLSEI